MLFRVYRETTFTGDIVGDIKLLHVQQAKPVFFKCELAGVHGIRRMCCFAAMV